MGDHLAVQGQTRLVQFEDAIPLSEVADSPRYVRMKKFDEEISQRLVKRLDSKENVLDECLDEIERLKDLDSPSEVPPPSGNGC
jgi:hypothetical protein